MEFDEKTHKVKWWLMNKDEARAYCCFLEDEKIRHKEEVGECLQTIKSAEHWRPAGYLASMELWESAKIRHQEDIDEISHLVQQVEHWFSLGGTE